MNFFCSFFKNLCKWYIYNLLNSLLYCNLEYIKVIIIFIFYNTICYKLTSIILISNDKNNIHHNIFL